MDLKRHFIFFKRRFIFHLIRPQIGNDLRFEEVADGDETFFMAAVNQPFAVGEEIRLKFNYRPGS